jgi:histone-lysine N-methyltransferase SETMAR
MISKIEKIFKIQKFKKMDQRVYIKMRTTLNESPTAIHAELVKIYGESAYSYITVTRWVRRFKEGIESVDDEPRSGRPITACTEENADLIKQLLDDDPFLSARDLEELTSLSHGTVQNILHDRLQMKKISSRWVPYALTPEHKAKRLQFAKDMLAKLRSGDWRLDQILTGDESWFYHRQIRKRSDCKTWKSKGDPPEVLVKRGRYEDKTMVSIFFRTTGLVHIYGVDDKKTVDSDCYIKHCLGPALKEIQKK